MNGHLPLNRQILKKRYREKICSVFLIDSAPHFYKWGAGWKIVMKSDGAQVKPPDAITPQRN